MNIDFNRAIDSRDRWGIFLAVFVGISVLACLGLPGCSAPEHIRIGFLGSLSGRVNDLGIGGLNGVRLAVDLRNRAGGVKGQRIELIEEDDLQTVQGAKAALNRMIEKKIVAAIGPMTSAIAVGLVPEANTRQFVLISPTVSTNALSGKDDYFFRVIPSTNEFAQMSALYYVRSGVKRIQIIYDLSNKAYAESWLGDFVRSFKTNDGVCLPPIPYVSGKMSSYAGIARESLRQRPNAIVIIGTSVETALISQELRERDKKIVIGTTEWAATDRLIALGGDAVENIVIAQIIDHESQSPSYIRFRDEFFKRYGVPPGFSALKGFDAANVLLDAIEKQQREESLKQTLVRVSHFDGAQNSIPIDDTGDAHGNTWLYTVRNGRFVRLESANASP